MPKLSKGTHIVIVQDLRPGNHSKKNASKTITIKENMSASRLLKKILEEGDYNAD